MSDSRPDADFRWQALFQRSRDPLFLLNRQRRFLFANRAWEELTGLTATEVRGVSCPRRASATDPRDVQVRAACCPPAEVLEGRAGHARRLVPGGNGTAWWDVHFLPLQEENGLLGILGRITPLPAASKSTLPVHAALSELREQLAARLPPEQREALWRPEKLLALRERFLRAHSLAWLPDSIPALRRVAEQARLASQSRVPALILGEAGTGKQWLARTIHLEGPRREQPFVTLDCARLPVDALADVLFAETGRVRVGTVYLREPVRLPRELQQRLLARLQEESDDNAPRILAGSSLDPADAVRSGQMLDELHHALAVLVLHLPPLRSRSAELLALVQRMLERANEEGERPLQELTAAAWDVLRTYRWPGNLRELYEVLAVARRHAAKDRIDVSDLPAALRLAVGLEKVAGPASERALPLDHLLEEAERRLIQLALRRAKNNKTQAAELLAVWRPRLIRRMEALGIPSSKDE